MGESWADRFRFFLKWAALTAGILLFGTIGGMALAGLFRTGSDLSFAAFVGAGGITGGLLALACRATFRRN